MDCCDLTATGRSSDWKCAACLDPLDVLDAMRRWGAERQLHAVEVEAIMFTRAHISRVAIHQTDQHVTQGTSLTGRNHHSHLFSTGTPLVMVRFLLLGTFFPWFHDFSLKSWVCSWPAGSFSVWSTASNLMARCLPTRPSATGTCISYTLLVCFWQA